MTVGFPIRYFAGIPAADIVDAFNTLIREINYGVENIIPSLPFVVTYDTRALAEAAVVPADPNLLFIAGYTAAGDGGASSYARISAPGAPESWQFQSVDGQWWELVEDEPNVKMFGAVLDGVADDTAAGQDAIDYATALGTLDSTITGTGGVLGTGAMVTIPSGILLTTGLVLKNRVILQGAGITATEIRLKNSSNQHVVQTLNFDTLTGTNPLSSQDFGPRSCGLHNLTINGNKANQSSAKYGYAFYGVDGYLEDVHIRDCKGIGWWSEVSNALYSVLVNQNLQSRIRFVKCYSNDGGNIHYNGPSDCDIYGIECYDCPKTVGVDNVYVGPKAGALRWTSGLFWAGGEYALRNEDPYAAFSGIQLDQSLTALLRCDATTQFSNSLMYDSLLSDTLVGVSIANNIGFNVITDTKMRGMITFVQQVGTSGGANVIDVECYTSNNSAVTYSGTPNVVSDELHISLIKPSITFLNYWPGTQTFRGTALIRNISIQAWLTATYSSGTLTCDSGGYFAYSADGTELVTDISANTAQTGSLAQITIRNGSTVNTLTFDQSLTKLRLQSGADTVIPAGGSITFIWISGVIWQQVA